MTHPEFGFLIPQRGALLGLGSTRELLVYGERVDESGHFAAVWVGDSLTTQHRPDAIALLGALAGMTERVTLGVACMASFALRDPAVFAYQWASLDQLSSGRTLLGACTGLVPGGQSAREGAHWGVRDAERAPRLEEHIGLCRALWRGEPVTFHGAFRRYDAITILPRPIQDPCPILIAANPWQPQ